MASQQQQNGGLEATTAKESEIMEVDMSVKSMDEDDVDAIIEEEGDLIEMDEGEVMDKYIEEDLDEGTTLNYDDLVVEDDGESLSNGATQVSTTTKDVGEEEGGVLLEDEEEVVEETVVVPSNGVQATKTVVPSVIAVAAKPTPVVVTATPSEAVKKPVTGTAPSSVIAKPVTGVVDSNGFSGSNSNKKQPQVAEDDDRPVSIPSDSEGEEEQQRPPVQQPQKRLLNVTSQKAVIPPMPPLKPAHPQQQRQQPSQQQHQPQPQNGRSSTDSDEVHEIRSDNEDCVMLDDTPPMKVDSSSNARKSAMRNPDYDDDIQEIMDDPIPINSTTTIQPVNKKMKLNTGASSVLSQNHLAGLPSDLSITAGNTTVTKDGGKFTFVDPKTLMGGGNKGSQLGDVQNLLAGGGLTISQVTPGAGGSSSTTGGGGQPSHMRATITPVNNNNISSSSNSSNKASAGVVSSSTSSSSSNNNNSGGLNTILLPALTDDMFVLEAPSFIVPYIYEKPPSENLKQIVDDMKKELDALKVKDDKPQEAAKVAVNKEATESGDEKKKEDEESKDKKDKKKSKRAGNADDSDWGESDESTDDDASDTETRTKVLIKDVDPQGIESMILPGAEKKIGVDGRPVTGTGDNYFESPLGQFFMSIGMSMVQEHVQADLLRMQKRKQQREGGKPNIHLQTAINNLLNNLEASRKDNATFKFPAKRCDFCNFKTESGLAMASHYEKPHLKGNVYKCNFCEFEARPAHDILYHMEAVHNMKSKLEKPLSYHQCPNCPFEDNGKSKLARHTLACAKKFVPESNLLPAQDWDPPAKIPRVKPRHGLVGTATAYQAMAAQQQRIQAATGMLNRIQNQQQGQGVGGQNSAMTANAALNLLTANAALLNNNVAMNLSGGKYRNNSKGGGQQMGGKGGGGRQSGGMGGGGQNAVRTQQQQMANALMLQNNFNQLAAVAAAAKNFNSSQLLQMASQAGMLPNAHSSLTIQQSNQGTSSKSSKNQQQPSISITPLPRQNSALGGGGGQQGSSQGAGNSGGSRGSMGGMEGQEPLPKPGQHPSGAKSSFVICEICDGYIKDLDQLRSHMQMIHKVKIHPKMIYNRPPLNCQKCQYRFFTDQGLERHLLGSHGLVTSSMQEAANCGQDSGRCPICGRVYQWKLLNHVSRDHNMTLKPAHLSYKCTVCTATFGMYKQFENHVYSAHSTVAKKSGDKKSSSGGSSSKSSSAGNDSLLKPLKINDEITIIPQPPAKMSKTQTIEIE